MTAGNAYSEQERRVVLALLNDAKQINTDVANQPQMNGTIQAAIDTALGTAITSVTNA